MAVYMGIGITGCSNKELAIMTCVDLNEPEKIGQPFGNSKHFCDENPIGIALPLITEITGKTLEQPERDDSYRYAEVLIICQNLDCPLHQ